MISLIEALNYRCLRYIRQPLDRFHVLVGPNASGKTTLLDVVAFLSRFVSDGLEAAVSERTANFFDLLWQHEGNRFELAVEATIPEDRRKLLDDDKYDTIRYDLALAIDPDSSEVFIAAENGCLKISEPVPQQQTPPFPGPRNIPEKIVTPVNPRGARKLFQKTPGGNDLYLPHAHGSAFPPFPFKLGRRKSTLGNLPEDESKFPASTWLKQLLSEGVEQFILNSLALREASPPGQAVGFSPDGSSLPWAIADLEREAPERLREWIDHLGTALPDLQAIRTVEREDDRHRYLKLVYTGGLEVPSWMASDGTLRLLALTLPAYLRDLQNVYLIEEPENGIHPRAVDTMFQSLSSVYDAQILMATHSPVILSQAKPQDVLCFAKTEEGATDIVRGDEHPELSDWHGETDLGTLFASGVLG